MRPHERRPRPWVKLCGLVRPEDAARAVALGADLVGLNFWPRSPRHVDLAAAREIAAATRGRASLVGVFVDEAPERVAEVVAELALDLVQLHGDEPPADRARFARRLVGVVRSGALPPAPAESAALWLIDAPRDARYGGTGESWSWGDARSWIAGRAAPALVAGGVRPGNAATALAASGAAGVDVASGVESAPGIKDPEKMRRLIEEVRGAAT